MRSLNNFIESPTTVIHFAGFESTAARLQQRGWRISAYEAVNYSRALRREIQLTMSYGDGGITMISSLSVVDVDDMIERVYRGQLFVEVMGVSIGSRSHFVSMPDRVSIDFMQREFNPIDAIPTMRQIDLSAIDLSKFGVFKKMNDMANIYLPEKTVDELLADILTKQAPKQAEIRRRERREKFIEKSFSEVQRNPNESIRAQLIAI